MIIYTMHDLTVLLLFCFAVCSHHGSEELERGMKETRLTDADITQSLSLVVPLIIRGFLTS